MPDSSTTASALADVEASATRVPHSRVRRLTAEHMVRSVATSAHAYALVDVDFSSIAALREEVRVEWRAAEGFGLTYLPFVVRALAQTIERYPELNSTFEERELVVHGDVNVGIAIDLSFKGLIVPVIRAADGKGVRQLAREITDLAQRARARKLTPDAMADGTVTVTNPGPFGAGVTLPIINQPQVTIIATDAITMRPVAVPKDGGHVVEVRPIGNITIGWDHRAFDGAYATSALVDLRDLLQGTDWWTELEP